MTRALARAGALALILGALGTFHPGEADAEAGLLMVSDTTWHRVRIFDPEASKVVYDLSLMGPWTQNACEGQNVMCFPMGFEHSVYDDRDFITVALDRLDPLSGEPLLTFPGALTQVELTPVPTPVFTLKHLDFRGLNDWMDHCPQGAGDPYGDPALIGCGPQFLHSFRIIEQSHSEGWVRVILPDPLNSRIMQVYLDYSAGSMVGRVEWLLGAGDPGWPGRGIPNGLQYLPDEPGGPHMLVTFYDNGDREEGGGALVLFRQEGDTWAPSWQFPDPTAMERSFIQAPHMAQLLADPVTGERLIFYAHGRGLASDWFTDPDVDRGGSVGLLRPGASLDDVPTYLGEGDKTPSGVETMFLYPRDMEFLPDGSLLVADAGCETLCPEPGQIHVIPPFHRGQSASPKEGYFSSSHEAQTLLPIDGATAPPALTCGIGVLFESHYVSTRDVGAQLRRAARRPGQPCEMPGR